MGRRCCSDSHRCWTAEARRCELRTRWKTAVVEVKDAQGNPVPSVYVGFRAADSKRRSFGFGALATSEEGQVRFEDLERFDRRIRPGSAVTFGFTFPQLDPVETTVAWEDLDEPIALTLPPHGKVIVDVGDWDDERTCSFRIQALGSGPLGFRDGLSVQAKPGEAVEFPFVGVGVPVHLLQFAEGAMGSAPIEVPLISEAGEEVLVIAPPMPADDRIRFKGRLVGVDGEPVADMTILYELMITGQAGGMTGHGFLTTDENGSFDAVSSYPHWGHGSIQVEFNVADEEYPRQVDGGAWESWKTKPGSPTHDCGELRLEAAGVLVHGVVKDDDGVPLSGLQVWLERGPQQVTDSEGRFELYGNKREDRFTLNVFAESHESVIETVERGEFVEIVCSRRASVEGRVNTDNPEVFSWITISLEPKQPPARSIRVELGDDGRFKASPPAGEYRLEIKDRIHWTPIKTIEPILVEAGDSVRVPAIELGELVDLVELKVGLATGGVPESVLYGTGDRPGRSHRSESRLTLDHGRTRLLVRRDVPTLTLRTPDTMLSEVTHGSSAIEVVLEPLKLITVDLGGPLPAVASDLEIVARLVPEHGRRRFSKSLRGSDLPNPSRRSKAFEVHGVSLAGFASDAGPSVLVEPGQATLGLHAPHYGELLVAIGIGSDDLQFAWEVFGPVITVDQDRPGRPVAVMVSEEEIAKIVARFEFAYKNVRGGK